MFFLFLLVFWFGNSCSFPTFTGIYPDLSDPVPESSLYVRGEKMADIVFTDLNGNKRSLLAYCQGKYVVLDFWVARYGQCKEKISIMRRIYEEKKKEDVMVLSISLGTRKELLKSVVEQDDIPWDQGYLHEAQSERYYNLLGIESLPSIWVVTPEGKIAGRGIEYLRMEEVLEKIISSDGKEIYSNSKISGQCVDGSSPVSGASVMLELYKLGDGKDVIYKRTTTDDKGRWSFKDNPVADRYWCLRYYHRDYSLSYNDSYYSESRQSLTEPFLFNRRGWHISGKVRDEAGNPLQGVTVGIDNHDARQSKGVLLPTQKTNAAGEYLFIIDSKISRSWADGFFYDFGFPGKTVDIVAFHEDYVPSKRSGKVNWNRKGFDFILKAKSELTGVVLDEESAEPLPNVRYCIRRSEENKWQENVSRELWYSRIAIGHSDEGECALAFHHDMQNITDSMGRFELQADTVECVDFVLDGYEPRKNVKLSFIKKNVIRMKRNKN